MLDQITQSALSVVSCEMAWLLVVEDNVLVTGAISTQSQGTAETFLQSVHHHYPNGMFPVATAMNPFAEVLLRNTPLVGLETVKLATINGGETLATAFASFGWHFISMLPLRHGENLLGVLVLADRTTNSMTSESGHYLIKLLRRQALLELENIQLQNRLAASHAHRQTERNFYQVVLDTIGDGLVMTDANEVVTYVSHRFLKMTGYQTQDLVGKSVRVLFSEDSRVKQIAESHSTLSLSSSQEIKTQSGKAIPVLMSYVVTKGGTGDQEQTTVIVFSDLSDLRAQEQALQRQTRRLEALNKASRAISSRVALQDVIQVILSSAHDIVKAVVTSLLLRDSDDYLVVVATLGPQQMHGRNIPVGTGIVGWVAQHARSLLVPDVTQDHRFHQYLDSDPSLDVRSMAAVPIIASNEVLGVLAVINREEGIFDVHDLEMLENLGAGAATAIENATLFDQTHRRLTELSTLLDASAVVNSTTNLSQSLEHISRRMREALDLQRVVISTVDPRTHQIIKLLEVVDAEWPLEQAVQFTLEDSPSKQNALHRVQATTASLGYADPASLDYAELHARGTQNLLNIPLRFQEEVVGVVTLYSDETLTVAHASTIEEAVRSWQRNLKYPWEELTILCHRVLQATRLRWCSIYRLQDNMLHLVRELGTTTWENHTGPRLSLDSFSTVRVVIESSEMQTVAMDLGSEGEQAYFQLVGARSCLMAPLSVQGHTGGVVMLMGGDYGGFDDSAFSLTQGIANIVGNALENAALYTSLEKRAEALEIAYREIEQADQLKDVLLQNISHELQTPTMHAMLSLNLIESEPLSQSQREALNMVNSKLERIADLVKNMVSVHASALANLHLKDTRIEQLAALVVRSFTPRAKAQDIMIIPRIQPNLPMVRVDQVAMSQVFEALIDNAIKFSTQGKVIEISIEDTGGHMLQVCVRDEGIGIPSEEHDKVFRQFYQVSGGLTRQFGGMGLGLSIVRKVIEAHSGKVWLESEVGKGTRVYFTLPKATLDSTAASGQNVFVFN